MQEVAADAERSGAGQRVSGAGRRERGWEKWS